MNKRFFAYLGTLIMLVSTVAALNIGTNTTNAAGGRDCDNNAIIHCGSLSTSELQQDYKGDVRTVFSHYGISSAMVTGGTAKTGSVTKDGNVVVGGKVVATGAQSVGRQNISGSSAVNIGGTTYYQRPTSVSFRSNSLDAFVWMDNKGQYVGSVIMSCGNPVKANPVPVPQPKPEPKPEPKPKVPDFEMEKTVSKDGEDYSDDVTVNPDGTVTFRITFRNTGETTLANVIVRDELPEGLTYVENSTTLSRDDDTSALDDGIVDGVDIGEYAPGASATVTFKVTAPHEEDLECGTTDYTNVAIVTPKDQQPKEDDADVDVPKECQPPATPPEEKPEQPKEEVKAAVTELPKTGPGAMLGAAAGLSSLTAAGYYWNASRRNVIEKLLNR